jgi:hypothetical protein
MHPETRTHPAPAQVKLSSTVPLMPLYEVIYRAIPMLYVLHDINTATFFEPTGSLVIVPSPVSAEGILDVTTSRTIVSGLANSDPSDAAVQ